MALTRDAYLEALRALLPSGKAWAMGPNLASLLDAFAAMLERVDLRAEDLQRELDPRTTYELLPSFERCFGLPDPCAPEGLSIADRRAALVARITDAGLQTPAFFIQQAEAMGCLGATLDEFALMTCESDCEGTLFPLSWLHAFRLNLPADPPTLGATCEGGCEDFLGAPPSTVIECLINRLKPGHTVALFNYVGA